MLFVVINALLGRESYYNDDGLIEYYRARLNSETWENIVNDLNDFIYGEEEKRYFVLEQDVIVRL